MPVIEIASWTASEAFLADPTISKPSFDFLTKVDGCQSIYTGFVEEDKKTFYAFIVWETLEHHRTLMKHPEYPQILGLKPLIGEGGLKMHHVEFNKDFVPALTAPTTEILGLTLKEGKTKDDLYKVLDVITSKINEANPKYAPVTWGQSNEESDKFWLALGWDSSEAHHEIIGAPAFLPHLGELTSTADLKMAHASLKKHI